MNSEKGDSDGGGLEDDQGSSRGEESCKVL